MTTNLWTKLQKVDPRGIYLVVIVVLIFFVMNPLTLPLSTSEGTRKLYDFIEKLPEGSGVVMSEEHTVGFWPEVGPGAVAVWNHAFSRRLKLIFIAFVADGAVLQSNALTTQLVDKRDSKYGEDYVIIGFVPGEEAAVASFARDFTMPKTDYAGTPLSTIPLLKNLKNIKDVKLWVTAGSTGIFWVMRQVQAAYAVPEAVICNAVIEAATLPYLASGQLVGLVNSIRGGTEYENLIRKPGFGNQMMGSVTAGTTTVVALVIVGNIAFLLGRRYR